MAEKSLLKLEVVTPAKLVLEAQDVEYVHLPGTEGEIGILPEHAPLLLTLRNGDVRYRQDGNEEILRIGQGFADVSPDKVVVLVDEAAVGDVAVEAEPLDGVVPGSE